MTEAALGLLLEDWCLTLIVIEGCADACFGQCAQIAGHAAVESVEQLPGALRKRCARRWAIHIGCDRRMADLDIACGCQFATHYVCHFQDPRWSMDDRYMYYRVNPDL